MRQTDGDVPRPVLLREVLVASLGVLVVLGALKHLDRAVAFPPAVAEWVSVGTVAAALQLYVPLWLVGRRGISWESLGLTLRAWRRDLAAVAVLAALTTVPFALGHHLWQTAYLGRSFSFALPSRFLELVVVQVAVVGLAEELFFRGYLQERMARLWPARRHLFGAPFGRAVVWTSVVFALAHFVGEYRFDRLGPFFPSLVFGLLRGRTGTIVGAVGYHAFCNILSDVLFASYQR